MLTPAEELGLAGMNVASRVRGAFHKIPEAALAGMIEQIRLESLARHVIYLRDGKPDAINVMACPLTVLPDQVTYIHYVTLTIHNALKRLVDLYMQDFAVQERASPCRLGQADGRSPRADAAGRANQPFGYSSYSMA